MVSLVCMWHNNGSNVSMLEKMLEKKTLKIYHILEELNYGIFRIYAKVWKEICKKVLIGCHKNLMHKKVPYIARVWHLENYTEAVDLYLMNWHLNRHNLEWISVVSLLLIPWMVDLSGKVSHEMKNGSIAATLMPQNSGSVPINLPNSWLKKSTAVGQVVACAPVMQWARVRSLVGTSFLGEGFLGFFLISKTNVGKV